jgi:hypothetical protein
LTTQAGFSRAALALIAIVCGGMGFVLATAAVPAQGTAVAADGLIFLRESALAWLALWVTIGAFRRVGLIARILGLVMMLLGAGVLTVAVARLQAGSQPEPMSIMVCGAAAVIAQIVAGALALKSRRLPLTLGGLWRVSRDGCAAHLAVIAAGASVVLTNSNVGDLAVGAAIAGMMVLGGLMSLINGRLPAPLDG